MGKKPKKTQAPDLVIVESPAKAKTINRYLGKGYIVEASMGHVRDLPARGFGIDLDDNFKPTYGVVSGRSKIVEKLKKQARGAEHVYLATDLDREGEAIAWHLVHALELPEGKVRRVVFNEITSGAIQRAFASPRSIDLNRVDAQQARRVLDRIVGYQLSPLLWRKVAKGLSAGRVQSVAVRLIVEREKEIRAFVPQEYWRVPGYFATSPERVGELAEQWAQLLAKAEQTDKPQTLKRQAEWLAEHECFGAELVEVDGREFKPKSVEEVRPICEALGYVRCRLEQQDWQEYSRYGLKLIELVGQTEPGQSPDVAVKKIETRRTRSKPAAPFTTATLQQSASTQLRFSASRTMRVAQALYEGVDIGNGEGSVALITYMRTDSTNLSGESVGAVRSFIEQEFGGEYLPKSAMRYGSGRRAQEAHEAVRPTDVRRTPASLKGKIAADQWKLYDLIWRRLVACQMPPAEWDATTVLISAETQVGEAVFKATGRKLAFDGYLRVAGVSKSGDQLLPHLEQDQAVGALQIKPRQHFTSPPPRYSEASLIKTLEAEGIGRPSTYANIIQTIEQRKYVKQIERRFHTTELGEMVTQKLVDFFPKIMDVKFTSHMEDQFDKIEEAHLDWQQVLGEFYEPFRVALDHAHENMDAIKSEPSEHKCPKCGKEMVYRWGSNGRFLACSGYPDCKTACDIDEQGNPMIPEPTEHKCEVCGKEMMRRRSRHGLFLGCSGYPECSFTVPCDEQGEPLKLVKDEELTAACDQCDGQLKVKRSGRRAFLGCSNYPKCKNTNPLPEGVRVEIKTEPRENAGFACSKCGKAMVIRSGSRGRFIACSGYPRCRNTEPIDRLEELQAAVAEAPESPDKPDKSQPDQPQAAKATGEGSPISYSKKGNPVVERLEGTVACPACGHEMVLKRGRFGAFLSCGGFPKCRQSVRLKGEAKEQAEQQLGPAPKRPKPEPTDIDCDNCGAKMVIRTGRAGRFLGCSKYPKCKNTKPLPAEAARTTTS